MVIEWCSANPAITPAPPSAAAHHHHHHHHHQADDHGSVKPEPSRRVKLAPAWIIFGAKLIKIGGGGFKKKNSRFKVHAEKERKSKVYILLMILHKTILAGGVLLP